MEDQFCTYQLQGMRLILESKRQTLFSLCVLHFVFSPVATFGNTLAILALLKASSLPENLRQLLLSLAFSDLAVGLLAQSMLAVVLRMAVKEHYALESLCPTILTMCYFLQFLLATASFLNVTIIAVDRLLAVSLHLRYTELVTSRRIVIALVATWLASGVAASLVAVTGGDRLFKVAVLTLSTGLLLTTIAYFRVYKVAKYHWNQIQNQFQQQHAQATVLLRERKSALNVVFMFITFVACYLPYVCSSLILLTNTSRDSFWEATYVTYFFIGLNSSLNPLVYCWRYREVRQIVKNTLRKILFVATE